MQQQAATRFLPLKPQEAASGVEFDAQQSGWLLIVSWAACFWIRDLFFAYRYLETLCLKFIVCLGMHWDNFLHIESNKSLESPVYRAYSIQPSLDFLSPLAKSREPSFIIQT